MDIVYTAFKDLFPNRDFPYVTKVVYSGKFTPYNANIRKSGDLITLNLSKSWKGVDSDIVMGLAQSLLVKLFKAKKHTRYMDMYTHYVKQLHRFVPKNKKDPVLEASFHRINQTYFDGLMEIPNLEWGTESFTKLGSYTYATDTITMSTALSNELELLDYVMYHELLHKKLQFSSKNGRSLHHSAEFRRLEHMYPGWQELEKRLSRLRWKKKLFSWF